ncbi:MAG: phosphoribosyl-AMP cyclohydrolase [Spirochaetes bacterium]|nr:phosphoribosyl-AMP cyclohydrolase [Spirochaetota bacterium]
MFGSEKEITDFIQKTKFDGKGLVTAVVQDATSKALLMVAYMNDEALRRTLTSGKMTYWSRSRQQYWLKGETSGSFQFVKEVYADCDNDALLFKVDQQGSGACHTGQYTCFFNKVDGTIRDTSVEK